MSKNIGNNFPPKVHKDWSGILASALVSQQPSQKTATQTCGFENLKNIEEKRGLVV